MRIRSIKRSELNADPQLARTTYSALILEGWGTPVGAVEDPLEVAVRRVGWRILAEYSGGVHLVESLTIRGTHYLAQSAPDGADVWAVPVLLEESE
jgi:hypothetical protein